MFKELKENLQICNVEKSSDLLIEIYNAYGEEWINHIKKNEVLPNPSAYKFSKDSLDTFLISLSVIIDKIESKGIEDALRLFSSLVQLYSKIEKINEGLSKSKFYNFPPLKQIQMLCVYFEDQSRLTQKNFSEHLKDYKAITPVSLINFNIEDKLTKGKKSAIDNFEALGDSIDLNLRYIFYRYKNSFDANFFKDVYPYENKSIYFLLNWANIKQAIDNLWQNIKYREWTYFIKNDHTYYCPSNKEHFIKEEASIDRYRLYINELANSFLIDFPNEHKLFNKIISELNIKIGKIPWQINIPIRDLKRLLSIPSLFDVLATEFFFEFYKRNLRDLLIGPSSSQVSSEEFLVACKYIYILSSIYQKKCWESFDEHNKSKYYSLVPVVDEKNLVYRLSSATGWSKVKCINLLNLLSYSPQYKKIDIWFQPLIPICEGKKLLIPTIGTCMDIVRLFESHCSQWDIKFDDRGPLFEREIREEFKKLGIPALTSPLKFTASDKKEIEYDVISWFKGYLLLIEAKCLRTPHSSTDAYNCWKEIQKGIEQLKRRRAIIFSDWNKIISTTDIDLPKNPPKKERVLCLLVTNIFTFTGFEIDDVVITDFTCLRRYLDGADIERIEFNQDGLKSKDTVERIWSKGEPSPKELWNYVKNPPNLRNIITKTKIKYGPIPPLDEKDKDVFCIPYTIVE